MFVKKYDEGDPSGETPPAPKEQTFTKDEFESAIAAERKRSEDQLKKTVGEFEELKNNVKLSSEERTSLQEKIDDYEKQLLTKEEIAKRDKEKAEKQYSERVSELEASLKESEAKFNNATIQRSIIDSAVSEGAFNPDQIIAIMKPNTRIADVKDDDGEVTGTEVRVSMVVEGKELDFTVSEAIEQMKEDTGKYGNLFKSNLDEGLGKSGGTKGGTEIDPKNMTPEQWKKHRKSLGLGKKHG